MNFKRWCDTHFLVLRVPKYIGKNKIECVIVTFTGHIHLLFEHSIGVSLFATEVKSFLLENTFLQTWLLSAGDRDINE